VIFAFDATRKPTPFYTKKSHQKHPKTPIFNGISTHQPTKNPLKISGLCPKKNGAGDEIRSHRNSFDPERVMNLIFNLHQLPHPNDSFPNH
jgi:hypothetical protein